MNKKAIFLDIDGTLTDPYGNIPDSAKEAIKRARANGHYVFICTGRSKAEIAESVMEIPLDGVIAAAGGYVEVQGKAIHESYIPKEEIAYIIEFFTAHQIAYYLEATKYVYTGLGGKAYLEALIDISIKNCPEAEESIKRNMNAFLNPLKEEKEVLRKDVNKVTFMGARIPLEEVQEAFKERFNVIPGSYDQEGVQCGEMMLKEVHKATGIELVLSYLGLDKEDSFGYGDSYNDIEMLQYVAYGIAMENAALALKQVADDITSRPEEDGLMKSFTKYHLI